ncbi:MAG: SUMF1/EgtB/PvdO family nonheme iron enzyme [Armatimonadetes bacterium]|nr:SUMF1/EgtB/PvdO family nonheme iron enzyme [Armatimonadota bacterium]
MTIQQFGVNVLLDMRIILFTIIGLLLLSHNVLSNPISCLDAKKLSDGSPVQLSPATVVAPFSGVFYVFDKDSNCGIRVVSDVQLALGQRVEITGTMRTNAHYERQIEAANVTVQGSDSLPQPVHVTNKAVGGEDLNYDATTGAGQRGVPAAGGASNNVGSLVVTSGTVTMGATGDAYDFPIDDGSASGLLVVVPAGMKNPGYGARVNVSGISSLRYVCGVTRRAILLRGPDDMRIEQPAFEYKHTGEMVYVPAGEFLMGVDRDPNNPNTWKNSPRHKVYLDGYWIGKYEVTRANYRKFIEAGGYNDPKYWSPQGWWWRQQYRDQEPPWWSDYSFGQTENHPVIGLSPFEMDAYCKWAGVRRSNEAEWEKAAGWDPVASRQRKYPWGDTWYPDRCNFFNDPITPLDKVTAPVGTYPSGVSYYGCYDMSGNVFEWCRGHFSETWYSETPAIGWINPEGSQRQEYDFYDYQAYKGGSWFTPGPPAGVMVECATRYGQYPYLWNQDIGFRVTR